MNISISHGFGTEDANVPEVKFYDYALFAIDDKGAETKEPIATVTLLDGDELAKKLKGNTLTAAVVNKKVQVRMTTPVNLISMYGIMAFELIPVDPKGASNNKMRMLAYQKKGNDVVWRCYDKSWDVKKERAYQIWPVNGFSNPMTKERVNVQYTPFLATWATVEQTSIVLRPPVTKNRSVALQWTFPKELDKVIDHWEIERLVDKDKGFIVLENDIASFKRERTDGSIPVDASAVIYRIKAVSGKKSVMSNTQAVLVQSLVVRPGKPTGFNAVFDQKTRMIEATWKEVKGIELDGYLVSMDDSREGEIRHQNNDTIKETRYEYKVIDDGGRLYNLRVKALSKENNSGEDAETSVFVPLKTLPKPNLRRYRAEGKKGAISWEWRYPENVKELLGFRMYRNGKMVADEKLLGPKTRNWTFEDVVPKKKETFHLKAVSKYGSVSESSRTKSFTAKE